MANDAADKIARFFTQDDGDGDFWRPPWSVPYAVTPITPACMSFVYTTKPHSVLYRYLSPAPFVVVGRGGLPNDDDVAWLRAMFDSRHVAYLGDGDPIDLMIFAWMRAHFNIDYLGVSDELLARLDADLQDNVSIPLDESELKALPLLAEVLPDYEQLLGPRLAALLRRGRKLEIEGAFHSARIDAAGLMKALLRSGETHGKKN